MICGKRELKKLLDINGQLDTVKRVICMDDEIPSHGSLIQASSSWEITSFSDVEKIGRENPVDADLPVSADIAVIMYTSGSTGLPKVSEVCFLFRMGIIPCRCGCRGCDIGDMYILMMYGNVGILMEFPLHVGCNDDA